MSLTALSISAQQKSLPLSETMKKFVVYPEKDTLGFDKIYMINLARRPDRRARMEQCFRELGILAETIDAIDGRFAIARRAHIHFLLFV